MSVQDRFIDLAKGSCLALCIAKQIEPENAQMADLMLDVLLGYKHGYIESDGYVLKPVPYMEYIDPQGRNWTYIIQNIDGLEDLTEEPVITLYSKNGRDGHFVIANKNGVIWNSLENSINVKEGKPISIRILKHD